MIAFQAPGLAAPVTVTADTVLYVDREVVEIEQRALRVNGVAVRVGRDGVPRLPIVEPERVSQAPMAITLDEAYRTGWKAAREWTGKTRTWSPSCPATPRARACAGGPGSRRAASRSSACTRSQTGLRGGIVSSEQRDAFARVRGRRRHGLAARAVAGGPGLRRGGPSHADPARARPSRATRPIPPTSRSGWRAAHASDSVMLRDTPEGYRVTCGERPKGSSGGGARGARRRGRSPRAAVRACARWRRAPSWTRTSRRRCRSAALSYLDFDFLGTGAQVNAFFAGAFLQGAVAVPSLGGQPLAAPRLRVRDARGIQRPRRSATASSTTTKT